LFASLSFDRTKENHYKRSMLKFDIIMGSGSLPDPIIDYRTENTSLCKSSGRYYFREKNQSSFRSPSLIQPSFRQGIPMAQVRTAGRMMQIKTIASQSMPVMASLTPIATSLTQPA